MHLVRLFLVLALVLVVSDWTAGWALAESTKKDIFDLRFDLGLWSIIVFVALYFILKKYAWGPILQGLQQREQTIRGALEEAHRARQEAEQLHSRFQEQLDKAGEQVREIMDNARRDGQRLTEELIAKARSDIQADRERLHREIETAKDQALQELWNQSAHLATLVAAKAIRRQLSETDHRQLVDEALSELKQAGSDWQRHGTGGPL
jgi:F-type H+-transporting ATPase subunit b